MAICLSLTEISCYQQFGFYIHFMQPASCDYSVRVGSTLWWDQPVVTYIQGWGTSHFSGYCHLSGALPCLCDSSTSSCISTWVKGARPCCLAQLTVPDARPADQSFLHLLTPHSRPLSLSIPICWPAFLCLRFQHNGLEFLGLKARKGCCNLCLIFNLSFSARTSRGN